MKVPSDNVPGYKEALAIAPQIARNYIAHTYVGDPPADELMAELSELEPGALREHLQAGMEQDEEALKRAPAAVREFFDGIAPPEWVDESEFATGIRMFHRNSKVILAAFVGGVLIEGFATNIAKSFFITGRVRDQGIRRLQQNNRHLVEAFMPGGLDRYGDGWKLSVRIRLIHAQVRRLLRESDDWDMDAWGLPLSAAHLGFALTAFSARLLKHMKHLGARYSDEERVSFMAIWRYVGYLMGIPETMLFRHEAEALKLFDIGNICEPEPGVESISMSNSLVNSAPLLAEITDPDDRRKFSKYIYAVSRAVIGDELADRLKYPPTSTLGVLAWFRLQQRFERIMRYSMLRNIPLLSRIDYSHYDQFSSLLVVSAFDEAGISYAVPNHVYNEQSSKW
jgi:hypothetical protein